MFALFNLIIVVATFISTSIAMLPTCCSTKGPRGMDVEINETNIETNGDPITFACIFRSTRQYLMATHDNETEMNALIHALASSDRKISLYFTGIGAIVCDYLDTERLDGKGWFDASGTNICYIGYHFCKKMTTPSNLILHLREMVKTKRLGFTAKHACDFITNLREKYEENGYNSLRNVSDIVVAGFSLGVHIGAMLCRCLFRRTGKKVGKLIGLDSAAVSKWMDTKQYIQKGDALYVQCVHSSRFVGSHRMYSDSEITLKHNCGVLNLQNNHRLSAYLHEIISAKKAIFIAAEKGKGRIVNLQHNPHQNIVVGRNECIIGVYNKNVSIGDEAGKRYEISIQWDDCKTLEAIRLETRDDK